MVAAAFHLSSKDDPARLRADGAHEGARTERFLQTPTAHGCAGFLPGVNAKITQL
jgi:hypothetical protein